MGTSALQQGVKIHFDNKCYILLRKVTQDLWQLEDCKTKRIYEYTDNQLRSSYATGHLTFANPNATIYSPNGDKNYLDATPEQWEEAKIRLSYVRATLDTPNTNKCLEKS